jgi:Skp family chaperone for outer membrane proteins
MTNMFKLALGSALAAVLVAQPGLAQTARKPVVAPAAAAPRGTAVAGIGVADLQAAVAATQKRQIDYKPTYDAAQARLSQLQTQLKPLADQFNADRAAKKPDTVLQTEYNQIQAMQAQGEAEIKQILAPAQTSDEYVIDQITEKLPQAVQNVMARRGLTLLLNPEAVILSAPMYDATAALVGNRRSNNSSVRPRAQRQPQPPRPSQPVRSPKAAKPIARGQR